MSFGRNPSGFTNEGIFSVLAGGSIQFWDYSNGGSGPGFPSNGSGSTGVVDDGHWHSVCFVKNDTAGTYYIDGVASGTTTAASNIAYSNTDWTLGKDYRDNDNYFDGLMDDMRVYDIALSPNQVAGLYGLEGYWKFDEGTGTVANDSSGNNNTGTIVGSPAWTTGKLNDALDFGNNQYVSVVGSPISSAIASSGQMTATAWVYASSATASGTIIKDWPTDSSNDQFQLGFQASTGNISGYIKQTNGTIIGPVEATTSLPLNSWHLVALTANGSSTLLYIDGVVVASSTYNGTLSQGGNYIGIGAQLNNTGSPSATPGYFSGDIDDVHLYDRGLLPEEILTLMEAPPSQVLNLQAAGTHISGFSLTWNANPIGDQVTDYLVQYSTDGGNSWTTVDTASASTSYVLSNLPPGDYLFRVEASNVIGQGPPSAQAEIDSPTMTYNLGNDCLALEHISTSPGDAYGHYVMTSNIDCSVVPDFSPIDFPAGFGGTFDGAGYSITNLSISTSTIQNVGLFSQIEASGTIENLTLSHANVTSQSAYSGILAGYNNGTIENVSVSGTSTGVYAVGGLLGQNDDLGTVSTSTANVSVIGSNPNNGEVEEAGGFVGEDEGSIYGSYSLGAVTNATGSDELYYVGGFAGLEGGDLSYDYATGPIIVTSDASQESQYIGGFVGYDGSAGSIDHSYTTGNISDPDDYAYEIGGFAGYSGGTLSYDHSAGSVYLDNDGNGDIYYIGGFVGGADTDPIADCYATGSVTAAFPGTIEYVGGFAGYNDDPVSDSYSTGDVEGNVYIGGFSGYSGAVLSQVFATGSSVLFGDSPSYVGGLVGLVYSEIDDAYSTGNISLDSGVTGNPEDIGGLIGDDSDANINRTYASGNVSVGTSSSGVGGLIGYYPQDASSLTNSYSVGTVSGGADVGGLVGFENYQDPGNPSYTDMAWYDTSSSDAVGDFTNTGGDNGPISNLATVGYGKDENTVSNFYSTTEPVYAQGQSGAWDFSSIWESHVNAFPTFQWYTGFVPTNPTTPPASSSNAPASGPRSGGSVQGQVSNLLQNGDTSAATALEEQYSWLFPSLSTAASSTSTALCAAQTYPTEPIKFGAQNDPSQVKLLEQYLDTYEGASLPVTGIYSKQDEAAVIAWQEKYASDILTPWNITKGTGYIYTTSLKKFKELFLEQCQGTAVSASSRDLEIGMSGSDVRSLQQALISKMVGSAAKALATEGATGYFGEATQAALIEFQKANDISPAAGYFGPKTKAVLAL